MKIFKIVKAVFALLIVLGFYMIVTQSYYGVVDENGNKITDMQEILLMEQEKEQENNAMQNEVIADEETKIENVSVSASKENIQEKKTEEIQVKTDTQTKKKESNTTKQTTVQEKQTETVKEQVKEQSVQKQEEKKQEQESKVVETKQETQEKVVGEQKCSDSKHKVSAGNSGKWFNSYDEAVAFYDNLINGYSNKIHNGEISIEEYNKQCPYGYEIWSCPYCKKWTLNYYYR